MERIGGFLWDDENTDQIGRHNVTTDEVEEAIAGKPLVLRGRDSRYPAYGRTQDGRWLFAVYVRRSRGLIRILTARDMTEAEQRLYRRMRRGKR